MVKDPNTILEPQYGTQFPGVIGCNLIWLGCEEFEESVWVRLLSRNSVVRQTVHLIVFAQMCSFYHQSKLQGQTQPGSKVSTEFRSGQLFGD